MQRTDAPRRLLIIGGTGFIGPHITRAARARGHQVTHFNRGKRAPELFPELETLLGDREGDLEVLSGRTFDAVIDNCAYFPHQVERLMGALAGRIGHYLLISTISVYDSSPGEVDEASPLRELADPATRVLDHSSYGGLKVACERRALAEAQGLVTIARPGLIVGPGDHTDRFTYWPVRAQRGGEMLAPGQPTDPVQFIDARDLAEWVISAVEAPHPGIYNLVTDPGTHSIGSLIDACVRASSVPVAPRWMSAAQLEQEGISAWSDMPVWVPPDGEDGSLSRISNARARACGLGLRPLDQTISELLSWWRELPEDRRASLKAGLSPEREAHALQKLKA